MKIMVNGVERDATPEEVDASLLRQQDAAQMSPTVPTLSPRQIRLALLSTGTTLAQVQALIDAIVDPSEKAMAQIEWDHATSFEIDHPLVVTFAAALEYTSGQLETLWVWAAGL